MGGALGQMFFFFKLPSTSQHMNDLQHYPEINTKWRKWLSIVGGVLDWMFFFFKQPKTSQYMDHRKCYPENDTKQHIWKILPGRSGIPLWEVFLIRCYSFPLTSSQYSQYMNQ